MTTLSTFQCMYDGYVPKPGPFSLLEKSFQVLESFVEIMPLLNYKCGFCHSYSLLTSCLITLNR